MNPLWSFALTAGCSVVAYLLGRSVRREYENHPDRWLRGGGYPAGDKPVSQMKPPPPSVTRPYTKGAYQGGRPASEMGPPSRLPSATIRPRSRPNWPMNGDWN